MYSLLLFVLALLMRDFRTFAASTAVFRFVFDIHCRCKYNVDTPVLPFWNDFSNLRSWINL